MREIDNRYPEFARPYEPVKGGRHRGPLTGNEAAMLVNRRIRHLNMARRGFLMGVGILILLTLLIGPLNPDRQPPEPEPPPEVLPVPDPDPIPEPIPDPVPVPDPDPVPVPDPDPIPIPIPDPDPIPPRPDPDPIPVPPPEPEPEPEPVTDPAFTKLGAERFHRDPVPAEAGEVGGDGPEEGDPGRDLFRYSFTLNLYDADTSRPITVRLQYGGADGSGWTDCPEEGETAGTLTYAGTGSTWEGELSYDVLPVVLDEEETGLLRQVRIVCDYTLTDGTEGTVYSTDCGVLYAYKGEYLQAESAKLKDGVLTAVFRADTDLVLDTGKLTVTAVGLRSGEDSGPVLTEEAEVSAADEDGRITVTWVVDDAVMKGLDPAADNGLVLALLYEDKDGAITGWESSAGRHFNIPPAIYLDPYVSQPEDEGWGLPALWFEMTLNSLRGGSAVGTLYMDLGDGYVNAPILEYFEEYSGTVVYHPEDEETEDLWSSWALYPIEAPEDSGLAGQAKIVFDIVYPDGETDSIETDTRPIHTGTFAVVDENYGQGGWETGEQTDPDTGETLYTMSFEIIIDETLVDPESVTTSYNNLWGFETGIDLYHAEILHYTDGNGTYRMRYTFVHDEPFPDGEYWFTPGPEYQEDEYNWWKPYGLYLLINKVTPYIPGAPEFVELGAERAYNPGIDGEYTEQFYYSFYLELNDADPEQDVTVTLEYQDPETGKWSECPDRGETVRTKTFEGTEDYWSGYLIYDVLGLELDEDENGRLWPVRIACDYTLTGGEPGTVYSTDCGELWAFKGDYLEGVSAELKDGVLTAVFRVDTELVRETSAENLIVSELSLWIGTGYYDRRDLLGKADVSPVAEDGTITVTYTLEGEELDPAGENLLGMELLYTNSDGSITDWNSYDNVSIRIPPVIDLDPYVYGPDPEGWYYPTLYFEMTLNSLKGGQAVGTLYMDTGSGFEKVPLSEEYEDYTGTVEYDPEDEYTYDVWSEYATYLVDAPEGGGFAARAKIVFDIVYPDGKTDTIETETRPIHMGTFAVIDGSYGEDGWETGVRYDPDTDETSYTMSFEVIIDDKLVDPDEVFPYDDELWLRRPGTFYRDAEILYYTDADGTYRMRYTYVSDEPFPDGEYWFTPGPEYQEDEYNWWKPYDVYFNFVKSTPYIPNAPAFVELDVERAYNPGADDEYVEQFYYGFYLELNDADTEQDVTVTLEYQDPETGKWSECPERGETERTKTFEGTEDYWSGYLIYDVLGLELDEDENGRLWPVRIACDYTLTGGEPGTVYSTDCGPLYAFKGEYLRGVSAKLENGVITAVFQADTDLVLDVGKLELMQASRVSGYTLSNIKNDAEISAPDENGLITVTYTLKEGETLNPEEDNNIYLRYVYEDDGIAGWGSSDSAHFKIPPVIDLSPYLNGPYSEGRWYPVLSFNVTLNSLKGGSASCRVLLDTGDGFCEPVPDPDDEYFYGGWGLVYDPAVDDWGDDENEWQGEAEVYLEEPEVGGARGLAKLVFDIVYPDGETDSVETETRIVYMGSFALVNMDYSNAGWNAGEAYDEENDAIRYTMTYDVLIDDALVDPEEVEVGSPQIWQIDNWTYYTDVETEQAVGEDGEHHVFYTFYSDEPFPDGEYWFSPSLTCPLNEYITWWPYNLHFDHIKDMDGWHKAPQIQILQDEMESDPSNYLPADILLNDLRGGSATATLYRQKEDGEYEPLEDEWATATYDPEEEPGRVWTVRLYDTYLEKYEGSGAKDQVKIVLEYTYPDGDTGSRELEKILYVGTYAWFTAASAPVYDPDEGTVTADLLVDDALAGDIDDVYVDDISLYESESWTFVDFWGNSDNWEIRDLGNGMHLIRIVIQPDEPLAAGKYTIEVVTKIWDDYGGRWLSYPTTEFTVQ